ncbi:MAG: VOC family protein [Alcaligenaceae bacterium]|jgi:catechol 2,3-dioxygenase-like lactoylglutathione lyase family enzyme|nr:VOC family protein [Alcaligenaceae bacterium]
MCPFTIHNIDHIVLRVNDMQRSLDFYVGLLGCSIAKTNEHYSMVHLRTGTSMIDIIDVKGILGKAGGDAPDSHRPNVDHLCLRIEPFNLTELRAYFASHQIDVGEPMVRYGAEGEGLSIYINDPDGNRVELKGPSEKV